MRRQDVAALMPCCGAPPAGDLLAAVRAQVGALVVVDDGMPPWTADELDTRAAALGADVVRLPVRRGKGHALAAGLAALRERRRPPAAVLTIDADGQHPPAAIPSFLEAAATADLVIGDRLADPRGMPLVRWTANTCSSALLSLATLRFVPDGQCGMRVLTRRALEDVPFRGGGMEAETLHLRRCLAAGVPVAWVAIPALYDGEASAFRHVRDSVAVLAATFAPRR